MAAEAISLIVHAHASWWDGLCSQLEEAIPTEPTEFINSVALRLVVVELAVRFGALLASWGVKLEPMEQEKVDTEKVLLPVLLREVLQHFKVTRAALAKELDVSKEAVDQWLATDAVVRVALVDDIAEVIAEKTGGDWTRLSAFLRAARLLTLVFKALRDRVGKETSDELVGALLRLTQVALVSFHEQVDGLDGQRRVMALGEPLSLGSALEMGQRARDAMLAREQDDFWKGAIRAMPGDWKGHLADALIFERRRCELRNIRAQEGLQFLDIDGEQMHLSGLVRALVPEDALPPALARLLHEPPEVLNKARLELSTAIYFELSSKKDEPGVWRKLMELAESCRVALREVNEEERVGWTAVMLLSYTLGAVCLMKEFCADESSDVWVWWERIGAVNQSLQSAPIVNDPRLLELPSHARGIQDSIRETWEKLDRIRQARAHATPGA
ncbi:hypothetical protein HPC49_14805 [Pyxidicoccus fallax]|uniref:Uncharacterized protein n=1 Tax=Pyxidicoccus fallax TaxID=394095 RepID=A0A848LJV9_9BACT|nr:hypothetical protein [Pyxidicoccus fallax]NMO18011.1 hypothetical protein [Pyxidicoccus fallax]NPC79502.1 hypothetical protein [Pyxidicoccus fallax]